MKRYKTIVLTSSLDHLLRHLLKPQPGKRPDYYVHHFLVLGDDYSVKLFPSQRNARYVDQPN